MSVIDDVAKEYLHSELREIREAMLWKLDGLSEYDIRRPLTTTGTNLLGLVKHLSIWESRYLGEVFDRPFPEPLPRWDDTGQPRSAMPPSGKPGARMSSGPPKQPPPRPIKLTGTAEKRDRPARIDGASLPPSWS